MLRQGLLFGLFGAVVIGFSVAAWGAEKPSKRSSPL